MKLDITNPQVQAKLAEVQEDINEVRSKGVQVGTLNDGYHSFNELYAHRIELFIALCREIGNNRMFVDIWASKTQSDGQPVEEGWFIMGINKKPGKQITYHIPASRWDDCAKFAKTLAKAPAYDGHTNADVLTRLKDL